MFLTRCADCAVTVYILVKCMVLWWRWRGQADAGLGALRSPAVRCSLRVMLRLRRVVLSLRVAVTMALLCCSGLWLAVVGNVSVLHGVVAVRVSPLLSRLPTAYGSMEF